jgi:hypothetical protein
MTTILKVLGIIIFAASYVVAYWLGYGDGKTTELENNLFERFDACLRKLEKHNSSRH